MIELERRLIEAIQDRLKEVAQQELINAQERIRQRMAEYVAGTVIKLMEHVDVDTSAHKIILRVDLPIRTAT